MGGLHTLLIIVIVLLWSYCFWYLPVFAPMLFFQKGLAWDETRKIELGKA